MKKVEPEIRSLFTGYINTLEKQRNEVLDNLTRWSKDLIRQIEEHVKTQRGVLEKYFDQRKGFLDNERKRINAEIVALEKTKDNDQIERLLAECKAIKQNLPIIDQYENPILYMRVITEEDSAQKKVEENQSQSAPATGNDNGIESGTGVCTNSPQKSTSASTIRPSQQLGETGTSLGQDLSTGVNDDSKLDNKIGDEPDDKCPVCFMIFGKNMNKAKREQHVNEHYGDD